MTVRRPFLLHGITTMARTKAAICLRREEDNFPLIKHYNLLAAVQDATDKIKIFGIPFLKDLPNRRQPGI